MRRDQSGRQRPEPRFDYRAQPGNDNRGFAASDECRSAAHW